MTEGSGFKREEEGGEDRKGSSNYAVHTYTQHAGSLARAGMTKLCYTMSARIVHEGSLQLSHYRPEQAFRAPGGRGK